MYQEKSYHFYNKYHDRILVSMANCGDFLAEQYIIKKYKKLVKMKARAYFIIGADTEDLVQEGMIGLYKAVRDFNDLKPVSFKAFAEICINRQIITAIKGASRQKHKPLNFYVSLNQPMSCDYFDHTLLDVINDANKNDPASMFLTQEETKEFNVKLKKVLSKLEIKVLELYLKGHAYREIAVDVKKTSKSIDNAMQRIKRKLEFINKLH